jgi:hypothetical protein
MHQHNIHIFIFKFGKDIVKFIKDQRIRWLGHVKRMEVGAMPRKMMEGRLFIGRRKGRPRLRWMDNVIADLKVMKIKQWMEKMKESNGGRLLRRPRPTQGCSAGRMDIFKLFVSRCKVLYLVVLHFDNGVIFFTHFFVYDSP